MDQKKGAAPGAALFLIRRYLAGCSEDYHLRIVTFGSQQAQDSLVSSGSKRGIPPSFIAVSSFGESHPWIYLTIPGVACLMHPF
ncbi:MAG: hypothetical protein JW862_19650 [Anaerolineales bacterium]|nr:hypothetical protein [Anaerolineales bacterium]